MTTPNTRTQTAKAVANFVVSRAVSSVVVTVIHQNTNTDEFKKHQKASYALGTIVLGKVVAQHTKQLVDDAVDSTIKAYTEIKSNIEAMKS